MGFNSGFKGLTTVHFYLITCPRLVLWPEEKKEHAVQLTEQRDEVIMLSAFAFCFQQAVMPLI